MRAAAAGWVPENGSYPELPKRHIAWALTRERATRKLVAYLAKPWPTERPGGWVTVREADDWRPWRRYEIVQEVWQWNTTTGTSA